MGSDGAPIYFVADPASEDPDNPDWILDPERVDLVEEVDLERANVARAPDKVMEKALDAALEKIATADIGTVGTDMAGRITYDVNGTEATIDSPVENLALFQYLMTQNADGAMPAVGPPIWSMRGRTRFRTLWATIRPTRTGTRRACLEQPSPTKVK